jgi:hypothetical protein
VVPLRRDIAVALYDQPPLHARHRVFNSEPLASAFAAMWKGRGGEFKVEPEAVLELVL